MVKMGMGMGVVGAAWHCGAACTWRLRVYGADRLDVHVALVWGMTSPCALQVGELGGDL